MTQAWTSGVERTWKSLSEWVNTPTANRHDCFLPSTGRQSGVSAQGQKRTHAKMTTCEFLTKLLTWLILCQASLWQAFIKLFFATQTEAICVIHLSAEFSIQPLLIKQSDFIICLFYTVNCENVLFVLHRFGSAVGRWRSSHVHTWVMCSERLRPTRFPEEQDRSSTKITGAWPKSGWMNLKTSSISSLLVSWPVCVCVYAFKHIYIYIYIYICTCVWSLISVAVVIYPLTRWQCDIAVVTQQCRTRGGK